MTVFRLVHLSDIHLTPFVTPSLFELCSKRITGWLNWKLNRTHSLERLGARANPSETKNALEHFQQKWTPVLRRKMRKNKELEQSIEPSEAKIALRSSLMMASAAGDTNSAFFANAAQSDKAGKGLVGSFRQICADCGQSHLIDADHVGQKLRLKTALSLIFATGMRPCNGALFVMSFAMLNRLEGVGMISVFTMALGTFITVSSLACLAVYAKKLALALASRKSHRLGRMKTVIELCAAFFIFITGALLLLSSLV